jgi:hypothetical protein
MLPTLTGRATSINVYLAWDPIKEQPFIAGVAAAFTLSGLALLYSVVSGEYAGAAWFIWMPIVLLAVLAPAMWWLVAK